jgi:hypothetical protein
MAEQVVIEPSPGYREAERALLGRTWTYQEALDLSSIAFNGMSEEHNLRAVEAQATAELGYTLFRKAVEDRKEVIRLRAQRKTPGERFKAWLHEITAP